MKLLIKIISFRLDKDKYMVYTVMVGRCFYFLLF